MCECSSKWWKETWQFCLLFLVLIRPLSKPLWVCLVVKWPDSHLYGSAHKVEDSTSHILSLSEFTLILGPRGLYTGAGWVLQIEKIKGVQRCYCTLTRMVKLKNTDDTKCWQGYKAMGTLIYWWWEYKMIEPHGKSLALLIKLDAYDIAIPLELWKFMFI